jgi:predicted nucleic acid-binding protein
MKLAKALSGVQKLAFDTSPIIYFSERNPNYYSLMLAIMQLVNRGDFTGCGASILLTEILTHPIKTGNLALAQQYENILSNSQHFTLEPVTNDVARYAANLRVSYNLRTPDALHIASAIKANANYFLTNDITLKRITQIKILALDDLEL